MDSMCYDNPENADKVPKRYKARKKKQMNKKKKTQSNTNSNRSKIGNMTVEILHMGVDITLPIMVELLSNPNVWIADTGVSCNSAGLYMAMTNHQIPNSNDRVTLIDGGVKGRTVI
eukprot:7120280-Ditylum_brightwellii.AAC.1